MWGLIDNKRWVARGWDGDGEGEGNQAIPRPPQSRAHSSIMNLQGGIAVMIRGTMFHVTSPTPAIPPRRIHRSVKGRERKGKGTWRECECLLQMECWWWAW